MELNERLMPTIRSFSVPPKAIAMWWLGQNGYIFKSPEGTLVSVDLYLSNCCEAKYPTVDLARCVPVLVPPQEVEVDVYACTHSHFDHCDPETIEGLRNKDAIAFVGAGECVSTYLNAGIESGRVRTLWPRAVFETRDLRLTGTFALPTDASDLNHIGFVLQFGSGPKVYITGDTDQHPLLYSASEHKPDLMITCINGGFNNLSHWEAADLASKIKPRMAIPCHYDMFRDNSVDPYQFCAALKHLSPDTAYQQLQHGVPFIFSVT